MTKRNAATPTNHQVGEEVKQHHIALLLDIHANGLTDGNRIELDAVASIYVDDAPQPTAAQDVAGLPRKSICEYAGCCAKAIGQTRLCEDHQSGGAES
ncbi:hypothetical protein [Pseudomonas abyssi]|uniref:hypothetical protein n=1 Tax=Pseudomonas abyssi TaxID=170540 RepID=UPI003C7A8F6E